MAAPDIITAAPQPARIPLYQYWDSGNPPPEVASLLKTWADDPACDCRFFDERAAEAHIRSAVGTRAARIFRQCANGALQADVFRLNMLMTFGGLYIDADLGNRGGLDRHLSVVRTGYITNLVDGLNCDIIYARSAQTSPLQYCHKLMSNRIETRYSENETLAAGPGIWNVPWSRRIQRQELFDGWIVEWRQSALRFINMPDGMAYKSTDADWRVAYQNKRSSYRDDEAVKAHWPEAGRAVMPSPTPVSPPAG